MLDKTISMLSHFSSDSRRVIDTKEIPIAVLLNLKDKAIADNDHTVIRALDDIILENIEADMTAAVDKFFAEFTADKHKDCFEISPYEFQIKICQ